MKGGRKKPNSPSMEDVAEAAGVSKMTVSNVLRDTQYVSDKTRDKVMRAVEELGYKTNPMVKSLMSQVRQRKIRHSVSTLAYVVGSETLRSSSPMRQRFWNGALRRAKELNFNLECFAFQDMGVSVKRFNQILRARNIRGLLIVGTIRNFDEQEFDWSNFSTVVNGYTFARPKLDRVVSDFYERTKHVLNNLVRKDYKRIGMVLHKQREAGLNNTHIAAFLSYQNDVPENERIPLLEQTGLTFDGFSKWLKQSKADVVIGDEEIYGYLVKMNLRMPEDIGFVGMHLWDLKSDRARFNQNAEKVGEASVDLLVDRVLLNQTGVPTYPRIVLVSGQWKDGGTVR